MLLAPDLKGECTGTGRVHHAASPLRNGCVNPALKVAVADLKGLVPPQDASDGDFVFRENREDLPRCVLI